MWSHSTRSAPGTDAAFPTRQHGTELEIRPITHKEYPKTRVTGHYEAPWSDAILTNMILEMENGTNYTQDSAHGAQEREDGDGQNSMRALLGFVLFLLIISTLLGNTLVCAAVVKFRHLRSKVTNFFVISLAVSDLFVAVLVMPWEAYPRWRALGSSAGFAASGSPLTLCAPPRPSWTCASSAWTATGP